MKNNYIWKGSVVCLSIVFIFSGLTKLYDIEMFEYQLFSTGHEIIKSVHPHPTMSEAIMESVAMAYDEVIHL